MSDFLNVSNSLTGRRWVGPSNDLDRTAEALQQATSLPRPLCQVLARRGVPADEVASFLGTRVT